MSELDSISRQISDYLAKPDRVPIVPQLTKAAAAPFQGISQADACRDDELILNALFKCYDEFGGWDALYMDIPDTEMMQIIFLTSMGELRIMNPTNIIIFPGIKAKISREKGVL